MKTIRKKMENKGFTLVEIIVCLAIMTIVAGSVAAGSQSDDRSDY